MDLAEIGMVQTFTRKVDKIKEPKIIFVDEAHHSLAKTYKKILNEFPNAIKLFFTATPVRTGKNQLDLIATDLIEGKQIQDLIDSHFLAQFKYYAKNDIDIKRLKKSSAGDYTNNSIDDALQSSIFGNIISNYKRLAKGKQAVVYCHSIQKAVEVAARFNEVGITAKEVDGGFDKKTRAKIVDDFRDKKIMILVNVNLFTEGIDLPNVDCVIMARPTESLALYLQFSMRCLNYRENKTAIIIDHVGNYLRFGLPNFKRNWKESMTTKNKKKSKKGSVAQQDDLQIATCIHCLGVSNRKNIKNNTCPLCGKAPMVEPKKIEETNDVLEEITVIKRKVKFKKFISNALKANAKDLNLADLKTYPQFLAYAEEHGYKKSWAYLSYKRRLGK